MGRRRSVHQKTFCNGISKDDTAFEVVVDHLDKVDDLWWHVVCLKDLPQTSLCILSSVFLKYIYILTSVACSILWTVSSLCEEQRFDPCILGRSMSKTRLFVSRCCVDGFVYTLK